MKITIPEKFDLKKILTGSMFYPAAGDDFESLALFDSQYKHFVMVDYSQNADKIRFAMDMALSEFGYVQVWARDLNRDDINPYYSGPKESFLPNAHEMKRLNIDFIRNLFLGRGPQPFAIWAAYTKESAQENGEKLQIEILYVGGEACATFDAFYVYHSILPAAILVKRPGEGFGDNWTKFTEPDFMLNKMMESVFENNNRQIPRPVIYLLASKPLELIQKWKHYRLGMDEELLLNGFVKLEPEPSQNYYLKSPE